MTPLRKHSGKGVFRLPDTLRFFMCPSLRSQRKRTTFFHTFPTDFRFRNHVFPQSLTCVNVAEVRNSVPETYYFVPSTGGNVKIRSCNLTNRYLLSIKKKERKKKVFNNMHGSALQYYMHVRAFWSKKLNISKNTKH